MSNWFALPAIGVCASLLMLGMAQLTFRRPSIYNVPGKNALLALPAAQQQPYVEQLALFMTLTGTSVLFLFAAIHYDSWRVAMGAQRGLSMVSWTAIGISLGGAFIALPLWMLRFKRRVSSANSDTVAIRRRAS